MAISASRAMTMSAVTVLLGSVLSACSEPSTDGDSIVVGGFVASPLGSWYADDDRDTLESLEGLAFSPLSVHVRRDYGEEARGVVSPEDDSAYIESIVRTSTGKIVVSYVLNGERVSIDFETRDEPFFDSIFGRTNYGNYQYGVQLYGDIGTVDNPAPRDYVSTARWYRSLRRTGITPYDGVVYEFFGTYGVRTRPEDLVSLGSASYEGHMYGKLWNTGDPDTTTGLDLLRGTLTLQAALDEGDIHGQIWGFRRFDYGASNRAWETLADTNVIEIVGSITDGRFAADWEGHDSGGTPIEDGVRGFTGTLLGEFYGPAGEEVGGVLRGHRDATSTTPEQIFNGFFSAGREAEAGP